MHAELCPVCKGSGKYEERQCHGCVNGRGWIEVNDPVVNYYPYYYNNSPQWYSPQTYCTCGSATTAGCSIHQQSGWGSTR